jgi:two-component system phosphate regulon sensor histidine kinase PhoR
MDWLKRDSRYLYVLIAFVITGLIGIQAYWIGHSVKLQKANFEKKMKEQVASVAKSVEDDAYCFSLSARSFFKKGEGLYLIKQSSKNGKFIAPANGGNIDTLDMFNIFYDEKDTLFYKEKSLQFETYPTIVDVTMKFTIIGATPRLQRRDTSAYLAVLNDSNFKEVLTNKFKIEEIIDVKLMDSLVRDVLKQNKLNIAYELGIRKEGAKQYEYLKAGSDARHLNQSPLTATFLNTNRFNRAYELVVYLPDTFKTVFRSLGVMMASSAAIIFFLILSYAYFIRTILKQRKLSEMKTTFINNITHEFRTPITNINLAIENSKDAPNKYAYYMGIIEAENKQMEKNVQRILQLATMEHVCSKQEFAEIDVHKLTWDTVASYRIQLENAKANVVCRFNAENPYLDADADQMKILFLNLLDNAVKYNDKTPEIAISTYNEQDLLIIQFEDNGIGMSQEMQKHIFTPFFRGHTGDQHNVKGFGLGLNHVKNIIDGHGGEIHVKSKPGKGTKFTIYFPQKVMA